MCIAIPMQVIEVKDRYAICEYNGIKKTVRIDLVPEVKVGDFVIIHTGFIIQKLEIEDAMEMIKIYKEIESLSETP